MRRFISDPKLLLFLDAIEDWWQQPVLAAPIPKAQAHMFAAGVVKKEESLWRFLFTPDAPPPTQCVMCHEILHLVLAVEGWPSWLGPHFIPVGSAEHLIINLSINLAQHFKIYKMETCLGYSERAERDLDIHSMLALLQADRCFQHLPTIPQTVLIALNAAGFLISHASRSRKRELHRILEKKNPTALEQASAICHYLSTHPQDDAQENVQALQSILDIIQWRIEGPQPVLPDKSYPGFFARMAHEAET